MNIIVSHETARKNNNVGREERKKQKWQKTSTWKLSTYIMNALQHKCHKSHFHLSITFAEACLDGIALKNYCFYHELPSHCFVCVCVSVFARVVCLLLFCFYFFSAIWVIWLQSGVWAVFWRTTTATIMNRPNERGRVRVRILHCDALDLYNFASVTTMMHIVYMSFIHNDG